MDAVGLSYHERLLHRLALDLPGLRPAFLPSESLPALTELRRFRHLVRHAYDLTLRADRLGELIGTATRMSAALPAWCDTIAAAVRREQGWQEEGGAPGTTWKATCGGRSRDCAPKARRTRTRWPTGWRRS